MREHSLPLRPTEEPGLHPGGLLAELRHILFDGAALAESRLEQFLDRLEHR